MAIRKRKARQKSDQLSFGALWELLLGPASAEGLRFFDGDTHCERVYREHKEALFAELGAEMLKSWAYRRFDLRLHSRLEVDQPLLDHERQWREQLVHAGGEHGAQDQVTEGE